MTMHEKRIAVLLSLGLSLPVAGLARADVDEDLLMPAPDATEAPVVDDSSEAEQPAPDDEAFAVALAAANAVADQGGSAAAAADAFETTLKQHGGPSRPCHAMAISLAHALVNRGVGARSMTRTLANVHC